MRYVPSVSQTVYELCFVSSTDNSSLGKGSFGAQTGERSGSLELIAREEAQLSGQGVLSEQLGRDSRRRARIWGSLSTQKRDRCLNYINHIRVFLKSIVQLPKATETNNEHLPRSSEHLIS